MLRRYLILIAAGLGLLLLSVCPALAQPSADDASAEPVVQPAPPSDVETTAEPVVEELGPPIHLMDKDGELVPVPGLSLEDFQELLELKSQVAGRQMQPQATLGKLTLSASAGARAAELTCDVEILLHTNDWVRIPLRFGELVLREQAYVGEGRHFLDFEADDSGYVCWIQGSAESLHRLTLKGLVPLDATSTQTRFKLTAPRSAQSELKLRVPLAMAMAKATGGATLDGPAVDSGGGGTEFTARRLDGPFELSWSAPAAQVQTTSAALESSGVLLAQIDGRTIRYDAKLNVQSFGGEISNFTVRLPPAATLVNSSHVGYTVTARTAGADPQRPLVDVQLDQPTSNSVEVRLRAERLLDGLEPDAMTELAGFEVLDSARQWGYVGFQVLGDWQVIRGPRQLHVRQVEQLPAEWQGANVTAGFQYFRQPFSMPVRIVPRETRLAVEPQYVFHVEAEQILLEARCKYSVRGAKAFSLEVDLSGWEVDSVEPANLVHTERLALGQTTPLVIPLRQAASGDVEVLIRARRKLPADTKLLTITLPQPKSNVASPAAVIVLPADNVALSPRIDGIVGLSRQNVTPPVQLPARQQQPTFYRAESEQAKYVADFSVKKREIDTRVTSRVYLDRDKGRVEQRISYRVAYEPLDVLRLTAIRSFAEVDSLEVLLDGKPLTATIRDPAPGEQLASLLVPLPSARIGGFEISIRFPLALKVLIPETSAPVAAPLLMPADAALLENTVEVFTAAGIVAQSRGAAWSPVQAMSELAEQRPAITLAAKSAVAELPLVVNLEDEQANGTTIVDQAWLQSWLTRDFRQDRAVFRLRTTATDLDITLPPNVSPAELLVSLNHQPVLGSRFQGRHLSIPVPAMSPDGWQLLELEYRQTGRGNRPGRLALEAPKLPSGTWVKRMYWQLVLPRDEHLLVGPEGFNNEFTWQWDGLVWGRVPVRDQKDLERWMGVRPSAALPSDANCYLFSALGPVERMDGRTSNLSLIVFSASLIILLFGLAWLYVPWIRHRAVLLAGALAVSAGSLLYPETAFLFAQAASLGVLLALLAGLLRHWISPRRPKVNLGRRSSSSIIDRSPTETMHRPFAPGSISSTRASPVALELSVSDSQS